MNDLHPAATTPQPNAIYRAVHDPDGPAALSTTVIHALADSMGVDPTAGRISLYDAIDPDALDAIFRPRHDGTQRSGGQVSFVVADHLVIVSSDGEVLIKPPTE